MRHSLRGLAAIVLCACAAAAALAGQTYFVGDGFGGNVYRLEDTNGDGDALDMGERLLWGLAGDAFDLARFEGGLLAVDATGNQATRLSDLNGDGDALDAGESLPWATGFLALNGAQVGSDGSVYLTDYLANRVFRAVDVNGDGDALDAGEQTLYSDGVSGPVYVLPRRDHVLVTSHTLGQVHRLVDTNGDGDALDAGESIVHTPNVIAQAIGLVPDSGTPYFVGSNTQNTIYRVRDANNDGDALDAAEVISFADNLSGGVNGPWGMAPRLGGGLLVANYNGNTVFALRDVNGDGDALDASEAVLFTDGFATPASIVAGLGPGSADCMITIQSSAGTLDPAAPNFTAIVEGSTLRAGTVASRLTAGVATLISTDAPDTFASGNICQLAGAAIMKTAGGAVTLTMRADDSIELDGGISSSAGAINLVLTANDASLAYRDLDTAAGDIEIGAAINTSGGNFTTTGVGFNNTSGPVTAAAVSMDHTSSILVAAPLSGTSLSITAVGGVQIASGGASLTGGGTIIGNVQNNGILSPGSPTSPLAITGNFIQSGTGTYRAQLGGLTPGTQYDQLNVSGSASLAGTLDIDLINGFVPSLGNVFAVLQYASRSGDFTYVDTQITPYLELRSFLLANRIELRARPELDGDINLDGTVNIFDVGEVSDHWMGTGPLGDVNGDGSVDIFDVGVISEHWMQSVGGGDSWLPDIGGSSVPEPSSALLIALGAIALLLRSARLSYLSRA